MNTKSRREATFHRAKSPADKRAKYIAINGISKTIAGWCRHYHKRYGLVKRRVKKGMTIEQALTTPVKRPTTKTRLRRLAEAAGLNWKTVYGRVFYRRWSIKKAISTPTIYHGSPHQKGVHQILLDGELLTWSGAARKIGLKSPAGMGYRIKHGWPIEEATSVRPLAPSERQAHRWAVQRRKELTALGILI